MNQNNRMELIESITRVSFYMDDLRLYLDTHPDDCEALAEFNRKACIKKELVAEYEEKYGPFTGYGKNFDADDWKWVKYPWPWEGACE